MKKNILGNALEDALENPSVDSEEVIAGHSGLLGDAGENDDNVRVLEGRAETLGLPAALERHLWERVKVFPVRKCALSEASCVAMCCLHEQ